MADFRLYRTGLPADTPRDEKSKMPVIGEFAPKVKLLREDASGPGGINTSLRMEGMSADLGDGNSVTIDTGLGVGGRWAFVTFKGPDAEKYGGTTPFVFDLADLFGQLINQLRKEAGTDD